MAFPQSIYDKYYKDDEHYKNLTDMEIQTFITFVQEYIKANKAQDKVKSLRYERILETELETGEIGKQYKEQTEQTDELPF